MQTAARGRPFPIALVLLALVAAGAAAAARQARTSPVDRDATIWMATPALADQIARVEGGLTPVTLSTGERIALDLEGWLRTYNVPGSQPCSLQTRIQMREWWR
jgi:hypothetical protein